MASKVISLGIEFLKALFLFAVNYAVDVAGRINFTNSDQAI